MAFAEIVAILPDVLPHDHPVQMPPRAERVPMGALGTVHRTISVTRDASAFGAAWVLAGGRYAGSAQRSSSDKLGPPAFVVSALWAFSHTNMVGIDANRSTALCRQLCAAPTLRQPDDGRRQIASAPTAPVVQARLQFQGRGRPGS